MKTGWAEGAVDVEEADGVLHGTGGEVGEEFGHDC